MPWDPGLKQKQHFGLYLFGVCLGTFLERFGSFALFLEILLDLDEGCSRRFIAEPKGVSYGVPMGIEGSSCSDKERRRVPRTESVQPVVLVGDVFTKEFMESSYNFVSTNQETFQLSVFFFSGKIRSSQRLKYFFP